MQGKEGLLRVLFARMFSLMNMSIYILTTAKSYGSALEFVWRPEGTGEYAVRESSSKIKLFKNFKEVRSFRPAFSAEGIFGGSLLGVRLLFPPNTVLLHT